MLLGPPRVRPAGNESLAPQPAPGMRLQPNGLPSLPILDRVA
jgi:hypothetical protein